MKPNRGHLISFCIILIIILLSCGPGPATIPADLHELETNVANTLTALSPGDVIMDSTPPPGVLPSDTPDMPTEPALPIASDTPGVACDKAAFVSETIPDGTDFAPSIAFTKTWRVRNTGTCTWNTSYAIVFDHGDALSAPAAVAFPGVVAPGQEVDLSLNMVAPAAPGTYESFWKFRNASGVIFVTNPFSAKIDVGAATPVSVSTSNTGILKTIGPIQVLIPFTKQLVNQESVASGAYASVTVECPGSSIVTGGGFEVESNQNMYVNYLRNYYNGWSADTKNTYSVPLFLGSYAMCLYNSGGTTSQVFAQKQVPPMGIGHVVVTCPAGSVVTGGGYSSSADFTVYTSSMSGNGWRIYAEKEDSNSGVTLNVYATCLAGTSATSSQVQNQNSIPGQNTRLLEAKCPAGSLLTGGGYSVAIIKGINIYSNRMKTGDSKTWEVGAKSSYTLDKPFTAYAICLTFP